MMFLAKLQDHLTEEMRWNGDRFTPGDVWTLCIGNPLDYPRCYFKVMVLSVSINDVCPECGIGRLKEMRDIDILVDYIGFEWLFCPECGATEEDGWWEPMQLRVRWQGTTS